MKNIVIAIVTATLVAATAPAASANIRADRAAVVAAMQVRAVEARQTIRGLRADLRDRSIRGRDRAQLIRAFRIEQTRLRQLRSFARIANRYPPARLRRLVEYFDLPVSISVPGRGYGPGGRFGRGGPRHN